VRLKTVPATTCGDEFGRRVRSQAPKSNVDRYREVAAAAGGLWIEHGALDYRECLADDVEVGEVTSFPRSVKLEMTRR
jgi:uncharacterized protein YbaA (DUF1428 family)